MSQGWPDPLVVMFACAFGAVVGSFLNVVIYRVPRRQSIVFPGSACPSCATPIRWYDNIPILSWLLLGARCRLCRAAISFRYPAVEAAAALILAFAVMKYGMTVVAAEVAIFAWISTALGLIDLEHQILPDVITYPSIALGVAFAAAGGWTTVPDSLLGAAVGAAIPAAIIVGYRLLRGFDGMGWGDVKYLAAIGAVVGLRDCLWVLVVASVCGAAIGLALIVVGRGSSKTALPFGTFLAFAVVLWLYFADVLRPLTWG